MVVKKKFKSFINSDLIYSSRYLTFLILKKFDPEIQKLFFFIKYESKIYVVNISLTFNVKKNNVNETLSMY